MARPAKQFSAEEADLIMYRHGQKVGLRLIANEINRKRGVFGASISAAERSRREVSKDTIRRLIIRRKTLASQNPGAASEAATRRKTQFELEVRDPEHQVKSSEGRVATVSDESRVQKGQDSPRSDEHDGKVA